MAALDRAILEITADTLGTGRFEIVGNVEIRESLVIDYILEGFGSNISAVIDEFFAGEGRRQGAYLDLGAGDHVYEFSFQGWEGATDSDGNPVQWGNTGNAGSVSRGDATGGGPLQQMQVFQNYLRQGTTDSNSPARLQVGEYSPGGVLDSELTVAVQRPNFVKSAEEPKTVDGTITCIECSNIKVTRDAVEAMRDDILLDQIDLLVEGFEDVTGFDIPGEGPLFPER